MNRQMRRHEKRWQAAADQAARWQKNAHAFALVIQGNRTLDEADRVRLALSYWGALDALKRGQGSENDIDTLAGAVNVSLVLAERTPGGEAAIEVIKAAQDALMRAKARQVRLGRVGLDGPGAQALAEALNIHDQQMRLHKSGELESALVEAIKRMRRGEVLEVQA